VVRRAIQRPRCSIGKCGQCVPQQFAFLIHMRNYSASVRPGAPPPR
jgi:hypothetical protein